MKRFPLDTLPLLLVMGLITLFIGAMSLPLPARQTPPVGPVISFDFGQTVSPAANGLVMLSAHVSDAVPFQRAGIRAGNSNVSSYFSPTNGPVQIAVYWSTRYAQSGAHQVVTATATDVSGVRATKSATVTLAK